MVGKEGREGAGKEVDEVVVAEDGRGRGGRERWRRESV
jgi:hypothetical protein